MRTCFEIEETDAYLAARELLLRRCGAWAEADGLVMSLPLAGALLDSRHFSPDGRLGYWTPAQVRRALLVWIPASGAPAGPGGTHRGGRTLQGCRAAPRLGGMAWPGGPGAHAGREHQARRCPGADRAARTGDEGLRFRSAAELPGLDLIVNWAKKARLVRKRGTRLVPVAKARPLLADAGALWQRAFEAAFDLGDAVCRPIWADEPPSPVRLLYDVIVPDVLAAIYGMDEPVPVARLAASVWETVRAHFDVDSLSPLGQTGLRGRVDNDVEHIFDAFEALGAVTSTRGVAKRGVR